MTTPEEREFQQRMDDGAQRLAVWANNDLSFHEHWPSRALCPVCYLAQRDPQPNHMLILLCPAPAGWIVNYQWPEDQHEAIALEKKEVFALLSDVVESAITQVAQIYKQRGEAYTDDLVALAGQQSVVQAVTIGKLTQLLNEANETSRMSNGLLEQYQQYIKIPPEELQQAHDCLWMVVTGEGPIGVDDSQKPLVQAALEALCWILGHEHIKTFRANLFRLGWQYMEKGDGNGAGGNVQKV